MSKLEIVWCSFQLGDLPDQGYGTYEDKLVIFLSKNNSSGTTTITNQPLNIETGIPGLTFFRVEENQPESQNKPSYDLFECRDLDGLLDLRRQHEEKYGCDLTWGKPLIFNESEKLIQGLTFELSAYRGEFLRNISLEDVSNLNLCEMVSS